MCGIAGALVYDPRVARLDRFVDSVSASAARGEDAFGVLRWSRGTGWREFRTLRRAHGNWPQSIGGLTLDEPSFYLHTSRAEPTTEWKAEKTLDDVPPFRSDVIAVAHNGIISNDDEIAMRYGLARRSRIDTSILPPLIEKVGLWQAVAELQGGSALAMLDTRQSVLYLCRNFMPLVVLWEPGSVCFASEMHFFQGANEPFAPFRIWELPPYSCLELDAQGYRYPIPWGASIRPDELPPRRPFPLLSWSTNA